MIAFFIVNVSLVVLARVVQKMYVIDIQFANEYFEISQFKILSSLEVTVVTSP
jgi:hypothetical protein